MAEFLSESWLDQTTAAAASVVAAEPVTTTVGHIVTGGPSGEVRWVATYESGRLVSQVMGHDAGEAEVTLTTPYAEARAIALGELSANVAFMRGRTKTTGPTGPLLAVLGLHDGEDFRRAQAGVVAGTTFPD